LAQKRRGPVKQWQGLVVVVRIWGGFGQVREIVLPASCAWFGRTQTV
jgi:hypothetical protein